MLIRISKAAAEVSVDTVLEKLLLLGAGGVALPRAPVPPPSPPLRPEARLQTLLRLGRANGASGTGPAIQRQTLSAANLTRGWTAAVERARETSLNLGVWMSQGVAVAVEDTTLVISFPADRHQAQAFVQRPENRSAIDEILSGLFDNVIAHRTQLDAAQAPAEPSAISSEGGSTAYAAVDPEKARLAMEDPRLPKSSRYSRAGSRTSAPCVPPNGDPRQSRLWSAPAKRSGDGAFSRSHGPPWECRPYTSPSSTPRILYYDVPYAFPRWKRGTRGKYKCTLKREQHTWYVVRALACCSPLPIGIVKHRHRDDESGDHPLAGVGSAGMGQPTCSTEMTSTRGKC